MNTLILITVALLPAILLLIYIWKKDPQPEPTSWLLKAVLYGAGICIPVAIVEMVIERIFFEGEPSTLLGTAMQAFFVAALPEECFKLLALWLILRRNPYFDEHFDGIVYAVCVGLGFAALENVLYIIGEEEWLSIAITRALLAVPIHYVFAVLMGYYYSVYHFVNHSRCTATYILLFPFIAHGVYDTLIFSGTISPYIGITCFFILVVFCIKMHKFAKKKIVAQIERDKRSFAFKS